MQLPTSRLTGLGLSSQPSGPVDRGHTPYTHLLVLPIMARDRPVSSFSLDGLPIRADQHGRHQAKGTKA